MLEQAHKAKTNSILTHQDECKAEKSLILIRGFDMTQHDAIRYSPHPMTWLYL